MTKEKDIPYEEHIKLLSSILKAGMEYGYDIGFDTARRVLSYLVSEAFSPKVEGSEESNDSYEVIKKVNIGRVIEEEKAHALQSATEGKDND